LKNPDYFFKRKNNSNAFDDAIDRRMVPITDCKLCRWLNRFVATRGDIMEIVFSRPGDRKNQIIRAADECPAQYQGLIVR
jgi:hypothetical protein